MNTDSKKTGMKYMEIYDWVVAAILNGQFPYNSKIPSESEMMKRFSVSRRQRKRQLCAARG